MDDEQYELTQNGLMMLARLVNEIDLGGFLERISQAEALAPIIDPTLYMQAGPRLEKIKRLAQALLPFQQEIRRQLEEGLHANTAPNPWTKN